MLATIVLDAALLADAEEITGVKEASILVQMGLEALVQREAARQLARLGGTEPDLVAPPRRRFEPVIEE